MKWVQRRALALAVLFIAIAVHVIAKAGRSDNPVGFQVARVESAGGPVAVALWYPASVTPRPTTFMGGQLPSVAGDAPVLGTHAAMNAEVIRFFNAKLAIQPGQVMALSSSPWADQGLPWRDPAQSRPAKAVVRSAAAA